MLKTTSDLVSDLATQTTVLCATVKKLEGKTADRSEPNYRNLQSILDDVVYSIRKLQVEVNT